MGVIARGRPAARLRRLGRAALAVALLAGAAAVSESQAPPLRRFMEGLDAEPRAMRDDGPANVELALAHPPGGHHR